MSSKSPLCSEVFKSLLRSYFTLDTSQGAAKMAVAKKDKNIVILVFYATGRQ